MLTDTNQESYLNWKSISDKIWVSQFDSHSKNSDYGQIKIYIKHFRSHQGSPERKKTIFLFHDLGQHHARFNHFIDWIHQQKAEYDIVCMDFVGHGLSSGTRGHFEKIDQLSDDVLKLLSSFKNKNSEKEEWIVLGHGLGGIVLLDLLGRFPQMVESLVDKIILSNFILKFPISFQRLEENFNLKNTKTIKKILSHIRPLRLFKAKDMLLGNKEILEFEQDPLSVYRPTIGSVIEIQKKLESIYQDSYFLEKPLLILKSLSDPLVDLSGMDYFMKGIKKELLVEKSYSFMKHDLYNERDRELVYSDVIEWIEKC